MAKPITLPEPVANFLVADRAKDPDLVARCFTNDAFVHDEGKDYRGVDAIKAWSQGAFTKYEHVIEPLDATVATDTVNLHARLSGSFPNSPVELDFSFRLANDKIARLEIN
jgi:ketosteroid isomerase-like protein